MSFEALPKDDREAFDDFFDVRAVCDWVWERDPVSLNHLASPS